VRLVEWPTLTVEQILSGALPEPASYEQAHDEWVLVLESGDWLLLPAGCPHTLLETRPGTSWLALHLAADSPQAPLRPG
jgi:hypothetical protein